MKKLLVSLLFVTLLIGCTSQPENSREMDSLYPKIKEKVLSLTTGPGKSQKLVVMFNPDIVTWVLEDSTLFIYDNKELVGSLNFKKDEASIIQKEKVIPFFKDFVLDQEFKNNTSKSWESKYFIGKSKLIDGVIFPQSGDIHTDCGCFPEDHIARQKHPWLNGDRRKSKKIKN